MCRRLLAAFALFALFATSVFAQGLSTNATKDDWEEINFETGSAVLADGFPSLLRLAELMAKNDGYRVKIEGHGDPNTPQRIAEKLGMARANTVKQFLEKYGARPAQSTVSTAGNASPKVGNATKDGRFMNRRVNLNVTDPQGRNVSAAGVGDAIRNLNAATGGPAAMADPKCCDEILKRLDKLDDILALLRGIKADHDGLKKEVDGLKAANTAAAAQSATTAAAVAALPKREDMAAAATKATDEAMTKVANKKLSLLGLNAGADSQGRLTFAGKGRFFNPFNDSVALQAEGEFMYFRDRQEGQFDLGLVNRYKKVQMGLFSSFKQVNIREFQNGGTLGQAAATLDYVFSRGRVGVFGTKGFLNNAIVNRSLLSRNVYVENYLRLVDQVGASGAVALWKDSYIEGNLGYLRTYNGSKPGMTARFVQPLNSHIALSIEGGLNETMVTKDNSGAVRFGVLFGSWLRPKDYGTATGPVPVDIPRVRYEMLSRRVRTGNDAPVADAGPDQIGVNSGTIQLDGSGSYDPDGDPITYEWRQIAGPTVTLNGGTTARASFAAAENQTYAFRLTVKDPGAAIGTARVTVTTRAPLQVRILRYQANPSNIVAGQSSNLLWLVENADSVEIAGIGRVDSKQGTSQVTPTQTTSYRLTARNATSEVTETVTVTVTQPPVRIITFNASPATIVRGESSTLAWQTENAETVTISSLGNSAVNGTAQVSPTATTTYTITATGRGGSTATATATVQVTAVTPPVGGGLPRIIRFTASPMDIIAGASSTVSWLVENADTVNISSLGTVGLTGQAPVSPTANTLYTITAANAAGSVSSTVGLNVRPAPPVPTPGPTIACTVSPTSFTTPGEAVTLSFTAQNSRVVTFNGLGTTSPIVVRPTATTTYTLIAYGANDQTAQCQATATFSNPVIVRPNPDPGPNVETIYRQLTISGVNSTDPDGLPLTYRWRALERSAVVLDPTSATTRVQLGEQFGPYAFELTVTNSKGISASKTVTINFVKTTVR